MDTALVKNRDVSVIWAEFRPTRTSARFDPGWSSGESGELRAGDRRYLSSRSRRQQDAANLLRQSYAEMLWGKQYFFLDTNKWLEEHGADPLPASQPQPRLSGSRCEAHSAPSAPASAGGRAMRPPPAARPRDRSWQFLFEGSASAAAPPVNLQQQKSVKTGQHSRSVREADSLPASPSCFGEKVSLSSR